jgi:8-oxo-dGTP pyrophosphatase MutT (NUDIX family)
MIRAAGILFVTTGGLGLFLQRSRRGDHAGEWAFPGGAIEGEETPEQAAVRECREETGSLPEGERVAWTQQVAPIVLAPSLAPDAPPPEQVEFTTFIQRIAATFVPTLNEEHTAYTWAPVQDPPLPLHPGCNIALAKLTMDEMGIARAMAAGDLTSPQRFHNRTLWNMRITGTGFAYRRRVNEYVYRRPEHYLTPEFLAHCNGLPVIMLHPDKVVLNSKEFSDRIVGTMLLPYINEAAKEVWGIARVYDDDTNALLLTEVMSTSPTVVLRDKGGGTRMGLDDGSTLLIEGQPAQIDHLAICEHGVWDKGGEPSGVVSVTIGDSQMTPEEKAKADAEAAAAEAKKKADAEATQATNMDRLLTGMDTLMKTCDSLTTRMDSFDVKEKEKADAEAKAKADAEEEARKKGDPAQIAADKAKKDADEEAEKKKKADAEEEAKKKADSAAAEKDKKVQDELAALWALIPADLSADDRVAMANVQERADSVFRAFGDPAPYAVRGETVPAYRRRLAAKLQVHSKAWKDVKLDAMGDDALPIAETQIYADAMAVALNPPDLPAGQLRQITKVDQSTGLRINEFVGSESFIAGMKAPSRLVTHIGLRRHAA